MKPTTKRKIHSWSWTLSSVSLLSTIAISGAHGQPDRKPSRIEVTCPTDTQRRIRAIDVSSMERRLSIIGSSVEMYCARPDGVAEGPSFRVRHKFRRLNKALRQRSWLDRREIALSGSYRDGKMHGPWVRHGRKGELLGTNRLDRGNGTWNGWYANGRPGCHGSFENGQRTGPWVFWYKSGTVAARGSYRLDKREGLWDFWYDMDRPHRSTMYVDGRKHGLESTWFDNGEKQREGVFHRGLRDGTWMVYGQHGELLGSNTLHRGSGTWTNWHPNGRVLDRGSLRDDQPHGLWTRWRDNSVKLEEGEYVNGVKKRSTWRRYDSDGQPLANSASRHRNRLLDALVRRSNAHKSPDMLAKRSRGGLGLRPQTAARLGLSSSSVITYRDRRTGNLEVSVSYRLPPNTSMVPSSDLLLRQDVLRCAKRLPRRARQASKGSGQARANKSTATMIRVHSRNGRTISGSRLLKHPKRLGRAWSRCLAAALSKLRLQTTRKPRKLAFDVAVGVR